MALHSTIIIPARLHSTRLPRKLLLDRTGKTVLQHTYERALKSAKAKEVLVAVDCSELFNLVQAFGGNAVLTSADCISGTDRVAEVAQRLYSTDIIVNVQADEPEISSDGIDLAIEILETREDAAMSTLAAPIRSKGPLI